MGWAPDDLVQGGDPLRLTRALVQLSAVLVSHPLRLDPTLLGRDDYAASLLVLAETLLALLVQQDAATSAWVTPALQGEMWSLLDDIGSFCRPRLPLGRQQQLEATCLQYLPRVSATPVYSLTGFECRSTFAQAFGLDNRQPEQQQPEQQVVITQVWEEATAAESDTDSWGDAMSEADSFDLEAAALASDSDDEGDDEPAGCSLYYSTQEWVCRFEKVLPGDRIHYTYYGLLLDPQYVFGEPEVSVVPMTGLHVTVMSDVYQAWIYLPLPDADSREGLLFVMEFDPATAAPTPSPYLDPDSPHGEHLWALTASSVQLRRGPELLEQALGRDRGVQLHLPAGPCRCLLGTLPGDAPARGRRSAGQLTDSETWRERTVRRDYDLIQVRATLEYPCSCSSCPLVSLVSPTLEYPCCPLVSPALECSSCSS